MTRLLINIDHVATLRNARQGAHPDPTLAARECELAGADGIVFHLREDRRHITDRDVEQLKQGVQGKLDFELSMAPGIISICERIQPHLATLVPERREEITTECGLNVLSQEDDTRRAVDRLHAADISQVAIFMDPNPEQIVAARRVGADAVELHTGEFANARTPDAMHAQLKRLAEAASIARAEGLVVHAGHGLDYDNYPLFREHVPHVSEVSIGFAVIARSLFTGLRAAVADMRRLVQPIRE
ncbi:MAG: pyridoxine 5'-phosphate synthase [Bacteroidetes bacterium CG12_big_fil_rev_8_21_14_0_65_60_17]|nr:MAG: pyridoxine 5'-phosphate synthase [Bacteroidetes bacterium CG12_big_fil_rev_8_21_14_0_65_60_17]